MEKNQENEISVDITHSQAGQPNKTERRARKKGKTCFRPPESQASTNGKRQESQESKTWTDRRSNIQRY